MGTSTETAREFISALKAEIAGQEAKICMMKHAGCDARTVKRAISHLTALKKTYEFQVKL